MSRKVFVSFGEAMYSVFGTMSAMGLLLSVFESRR